MNNLVLKKGKTFIIAEAGVNHNGSVELAKRMIDVAADAGADAVKFQTFKAENIVTKNAPKAQYQKSTTGDSESQFDMLKKLEFDDHAYEQLIAYCKQKAVVFMSTPFDLESADYLNRYGMKIFKIASGEITNFPLLRKIGSLGCDIIMSTGMAILGEIEAALEILVDSGTPLEKITVLHCNSEYPTSMEDVNLTAMLTIGNVFKVKVGYSDHTPGIEIPIAAVALGASVIEKHFTLDKSMKGPDHKASLEPVEIRAMVKAIRNIEKAMGNGCKRPSPSEEKNLLIARKSIVAACFIPAGTKLKQSHICCKRPGNGLPPAMIDFVIGQRAKVDLMTDDTISWETIC